jgi:RNA polymerase sigma-70 factor (ECF subfamily)
MSRFEGKTYREIAHEQNVSIKTVEYRISQVLRKLETDLADYLPVFTGLLAFLFSQPR